MEAIQMQYELEKRQVEEEELTEEEFPNLFELERKKKEFLQK